MRSSGLRKALWISLLMALVIYTGGFTLDQHLRTYRGPWEVTFTHDANGAPAIIVNQPNLHVAHLKIVFAGEQASNASASVKFDLPEKPVPFGKIEFEDLTYLPGTETFNFFGHEVELLPRTLYINRRPRAWESHTTLILTPADKPASLPAPELNRKD
jgi:hypothetical protein